LCSKKEIKKMLTILGAIVCIVSIFLILAGVGAFVLGPFLGPVGLAIAVLAAIYSLIFNK